MLAVDAFAGCALRIDHVIERSVPIEQPTFLPIGIFDAASTFGELGMVTDLPCPFRKE